MAKVTLNFPRTFRVGGELFARGVERVVSDDLGLYLRDTTEKNQFTVVLAADIHKAAETKMTIAVQKPDADTVTADILRAVATLTPGDPNHFTKAGLPQLAALTELVGYPVAAADREAALATIQREPVVVKEDEQPANKVVTTEEMAGEGGVRLKITRRTKPVAPDEGKGDMTSDDLLDTGGHTTETEKGVEV